MAQHFAHYLKRALLNHWNLLAVGAAAAFGLISGYADIILPLTMAAEIVYLGTVASHPRFQAFVDMMDQPSPTIPEPASSVPDEKIREILFSLNPTDRNRFEDLKNLCLELRRIAEKLGNGTEAINSTLSQMHASGVNRMLWIFLKLLHSKNALESFFRTTKENDIRADIARSKQRLDELMPQGQTDPKNENKLNSLLDTLSASEQRLKNYEIAVENHKFIELELDRLYSRIAGLAEQGVNRQDPNFLATEVDVVSDYLEQAEKTVKEMDFLPDLSSFNERPPSLLGQPEERPVYAAQTSRKGRGKTAQ